MRTFPAAFTAEKNKLTGAAPVWILKLTAGGVDYYLSDNTFPVAPWGITTRGWVQSWGQLQEGISGTLDEYRIADFDLDVLITPESPNMETLATGSPLEEVPVTLYLWFYGCADPPQEMSRGYIKEIEIPDETVVKLQIQDESLRLERAMIGSMVSTLIYPYADPDDVGKVIPIPFGSVTKLPALAVNAGFMTSLPSPLSAGATSITVSDADGLLAGKVIQIDEEQILIGNVAGDTLSGCTRGYGGTISTTHQTGALVWERKATFDYIASQIPLTAIPKVYGAIGDRDLDITAICTIYLGTAGNEHPSYPGKAVVSVPGKITVAQAVNLVATGGLTLQQATDVVNTIAVTNDISVSTLIDVIGELHTHAGATNIRRINITDNSVATDLATAPERAYDGDPMTGASGTAATALLRVYTGPTQEGAPPIRARAGVLYYAAGTFNLKSRVYGTYSPTVNPPSGTRLTAYTEWVPVTSWANFRTTTSYIEMSYVTGAFVIYDVWWEVEVDTTPGEIAAAATATGASSVSGSLPITGTSALASAISGDPAISGNSVANTMVGDRILCNVVSPVTAFVDVFNWLLAEAGYTGTFQAVGNWPASYAFSGAITEYKAVLYWLNTLAFQVRAWFKISCGVARLIYRPDTLTSIKTITACRLSDGRKAHSRRKSDYDEVVNKISLRYNRDWSQDPSDTAYRSVVIGSDGTSISTYGARERGELFNLDFVANDAMAADLLAYYLGWYKDRHWLHEFETFLNDAELEFGDAVNLGFASGATVQLLEAGLSPGSTTKSDVISMTAIV